MYSENFLKNSITRAIEALEGQLSTRGTRGNLFSRIGKALFQMFEWVLNTTLEIEGKI